MMRRRLAWIVVAAGLVAATAVVVVAFAPRDPLMAGYDAIEPGMKEATVLTLLGEPTNVGFVPPGGDRKHCTWLAVDERGVRPMVVVLFDADGAVIWKSWLLVDRTGKLGPAYPTWRQQLQARWGY